MRTVKKKYAILTFQIGVNVIGLPCFHSLQTSRVEKEFVSKSKFI